MPKVKKSTKKDPPEKVLADLAKKYPQLLNLAVPPQKDDKLRQGEERSVAEKGADVLRALAQPINYMREVGEGNYVPTQAELEAKGISPMEQAIALANPADHVYAALASSDVVNDPNYRSEDGVSYGSPGLVSLIAGSAPQRVSRDLDKSIKVLKEAGIKTFGELNSKDLSSLSETAREAAKDVARVVENANKLGPALRNETGLNREFITPGTQVPFNLRNYLMNDGSAAVLQYDPSKPLSSDPFMKDMLDYNSDLFSRDYLTSYRGVTAENADQAAHFLNNPGGTGGRVMGDGVYVTQDLDLASRYATPGISDQIGAGSLPGKDVSGYVGKVRQQLPFYGYKNVLKDLAKREFIGRGGGEKGMETMDRVRVIRPHDTSAGRLQVQDVVSLDDIASSGLGAFKRGDSPKYYNERSLDFGDTPDQYIRSFFKSREFNKGGKFKVNKKAQGGMKIQKDPPKGYKRDADGYLTPVDFNEFHEMPSDSLNVDAIKKGISMAESLGGVLMMNPTSTATGMYGQRYSEIKDLPFMKGISREQFAQSPELQERVFDMRMEEGIGGPSLRRNAMELTEEYAPQLGDDWNFSLDDVAFLSNFLGRQRTREYFASLRDGTDFSVPGTNKTVDEYLKIARGAAYKD